MAYLSRFAVSCASDLVGSQDLKVYQIDHQSSHQSRKYCAVLLSPLKSLSFLSNVLMASKRTGWLHQDRKNFSMDSISVLLPYW